MLHQNGLLLVLYLTVSCILSFVQTSHLSFSGHLFPQLVHCHLSVCEQLLETSNQLVEINRQKQAASDASYPTYHLG